MNHVLNICCGLNFHSSSFITDSKVWATAAASKLNSLRSFCVQLGLISKICEFVGTLSKFGEKANIMPVVPFQWNHHILCSILINCCNLCALTHIGKMSRYTRFDACWQNVVIYALWRILAKCRDLRTLPGTKCWLPGTFNYSAPLPVSISLISPIYSIHSLSPLYIDVIARTERFIT